jgi:hypothetical protein
MATYSATASLSIATWWIDDDGDAETDQLLPNSSFSQPEPMVSPALSAL